MGNGEWGNRGNKWGNGEYRIGEWGMGNGEIGEMGNANTMNHMIFTMLQTVFST